MNKQLVAMAMVTSITSTLGHANDYFVRPAGEMPSGSGDGESYAGAWAGIDEIAWASIGGGDTLYICGVHEPDGIEEEPFGQNATLKITESGTVAAPLVVTGDCESAGGGTGSNGVIRSSRSFNDEAFWAQDPNEPTEWVSGDETFPRFQGRAPGFVLFGDEAQANMEPVITGSKPAFAQRRVWWDEARERLVIFSSGHPVTVYTSIRVPIDHTSIEMENQSYVTIKDIAYKHAKSAGIKVGGDVNDGVDGISHDIVIANTRGSYLGGGENPSGGRAGDCIQLWGNTHDVVIENNFFTQCFDFAVGAQIYSSNGQEEMYNVWIVDNIATHSGAGFGMAAYAYVTGGSDVYDVWIRNNVVIDAGFGWSGHDNSVHGLGLQVYEKHKSGELEADKPDVRDVTIEDNVVSGFTWVGIINRESEATIENNVILGGSADYAGPGSAATAAGILVHGNDFDSGAGGDATQEATGLIEGNFITGNAGYGIFVINNKPDGGSIARQLNLTSNTLAANGAAGGVYANFGSQASAQIVRSDDIEMASSCTVHESGSCDNWIETYAASDAAYDGFVIEDSSLNGLGSYVDDADATKRGLRVGDKASRPVKSFVSFSTSALPLDGHLKSASLTLTKGSTLNDAGSLGSMLVDMSVLGFDGDLGLNSGDYEAVATAELVATEPNPAALSDLSAVKFELSTLAVGLIQQAREMGNTEIQFRVYFEHSSDPDSENDHVTFYASENVTPSYRPVLELEYETVQ